MKIKKYKTKGPLYAVPSSCLHVFRSLLIVFFFFKFWFTGQFDAKLPEFLDINGRKHNRSMSLASTELWKLFQCKACGFIIGCADR